MYMLLLMFLNLVLVALAVVSVVKNFLVNFNVSDSGGKTVLVIVLLIIALLCGGYGYTEAYTVRDISALLLTPLTDDSVREYKEQIPIRTTISVVSTLIGYVAYLISVRLIKNIKEKKLRQIEQNKENRWVKKSI